jgi:hypothetical protein
MRPLLLEQKCQLTFNRGRDENRLEGESALDNLHKAEIESQLADLDRLEQTASLAPWSIAGNGDIVASPGPKGVNDFAFICALRNCAATLIRQARSIVTIVADLDSVHEALDLPWEADAGAAVRRLKSEHKALGERRDRYYKQMQEARSQRDVWKTENESRADWIRTMNEILGYNNEDGKHSVPCPHDIAKRLVCERDEARAKCRDLEQQLLNLGLEKEVQRQILEAVKEHYFRLQRFSNSVVKDRNSARAERDQLKAELQPRNGHTFETLTEMWERAHTELAKAEGVLNSLRQIFSKRREYLKKRGVNRIEAWLKGAEALLK